MYTILEGDSTTLAQKVSSHLSDGWAVHGSPYAINNTHYQAVVKDAVKTAPAKVAPTPAKDNK